MEVEMFLDNSILGIKPLIIVILGNNYSSIWAVSTLFLPNNYILKVCIGQDWRVQNQCPVINSFSGIQMNF